MGTATEIAISLYTSELQKLGYNSIDNELLAAIVGELRVAAYDIETDAALVSGRDATELARVIKNLFIKNLGIESEQESMPMLTAALEKYGMSNPKKYRVPIYYMVIIDNNLRDVFMA
jgi:hypothetical protein